MYAFVMYGLDNAKANNIMLHYLHSFGKPSALDDTTSMYHTPL